MIKPVSIGVMALIVAGSLTACGGSQPKQLQDIPPSPPVAQYTPPPPNTDPFKDWVNVGDADGYWGTKASYLCTRNGTAYYQFAGSVIQIIPNSPDCKAR